MTTEPIPAERAVALAKFLIQALGEALELVSRPWDPITLEQAYDPATPPFGVALVADRLKLAVDAVAAVVPVPQRKPEKAGSFNKDAARAELDELVRRLGAFVVEAGRANDAEAVSRAATTIFVTVGVTVGNLQAEAERTALRQGWLKAKEVASESSPAFPA